MKLAEALLKMTADLSVNDLDPSAYEALYRSVVRVCEGDTAVLGAGADWFCGRTRRKDLSVKAIEKDQIADIGQRFDTIVLMGYLENCVDIPEAEALAQVAELLSPFGKIVCCVPNEDFLPGNTSPTRFSEDRLRKLLKPFGRIRPLISQPMMWIVLSVGKNRQPSRSMQARYQVLAGLCRGRVLDLGCGPGHGTATISANGHETLGFDINKKKIAFAKEIFPDLAFGTADILRLPEGIGLFDTVTMAEVIEHVDQETGVAFLDTAWQHVAPGGRLVVSVPNLSHVPHKNHITEFSWQALRDLLAVYGKPEIVVDQPYKWLLMYVEKKI